jgi:hypothetical protein
VGQVGNDSGDPEWIRTTGLEIRNFALYPTELRDHYNQSNPSNKKRQLVRFPGQQDWVKPIRRMVNNFHKSLTGEY